MNGCVRLLVVLTAGLFLSSGAARGLTIGDVDGSGVVDEADAVALAAALRRGDAGDAGTLDVDLDGRVGESDLTLLRAWLAERSDDAEGLPCRILGALFGQETPAPGALEGWIGEAGSLGEEARGRLADLLLGYLEAGGGSVEPPVRASPRPRVSGRDTAFLTVVTLLEKSPPGEALRGQARRLRDLVEGPASEGNAVAVAVRRRVARVLTRPDGTAPSTPVAPVVTRLPPAEGQPWAFVALVLGAVVFGGCLVAWVLSRRAREEAKPAPVASPAPTGGARRVRLATTYLQAGDCARAAREFERALAEAGSDVERSNAELGLSASLAGLGRVDEARVHVGRVDMARSDLNLQYSLAASLESRGERDSARDIFASIMARDVSYRDVSSRIMSLGPSGMSRLFDQRSLEKNLAPRYVDFRLLGQGGMGFVYRVRDTTTGAEVALKVISPLAGEGEETQRRFEREIRALAALDHPGIVRVFDVGTGAVPYYTMEYVEGRSLADVVATGELKGCYERLARVAWETASALAHAHGRGILHRDIKPGNVLLMPGDRVKILDFGLARIEEATRLTRTNQMLGTPLYIAPELTRGGTPTPAADVYSYGAMLYQLVAGELPWTGAQAVAGLPRRVPRLDVAVPGCPPVLAELVAGCLVEDPTARIGDFSTVVAGFRRLAGGGSTG